MRHRLLALATAGALVLSSLVLGTYAAQADDDNTVVVQTDEGTAAEAAAEDSTPVVQDEDSTPVVPDDSTSVVPDDDPGVLTDDEIVASDADPMDIQSVEPTDELIDDPTDDQGVELDSSPVQADAAITSDDQADAAVTITGTVTAVSLIDYVRACEVTGNPGDSYRSASSCTDASLSDDGSYSVAVTPGATIVVYAIADESLFTYVGGYTDSIPASNVVTDSITLIATPAQGGVVSGQNIHIVMGGTISGSVILPDGYSWPPVQTSQVWAYPIAIDSSTGTLRITGSPVTGILSGSRGCSIEHAVCSDYRIITLVPGRQYLVMVPSSSLYVNPSNDFVSTAHGGYASAQNYSSWDLTRPDIELVTAVAGDVPNVDITLVKGMAISGTLTLPSGYTLSGGNVTAIELTQTQNGFSQGDSFAGQLSSDGQYRISGLTPGATYAVFASPARLTLSQGNWNDLLASFYGGYTTYYVLGGEMEGLNYSESTIQKISSTTDVSGVDITMALGAKITGTVYIPDGVTPADLNASSIYCTSVDDYNRSGTYSWGIVLSGGTYSCTGIPGQQYVVRATVSGYPSVWRGQFVGRTPTLPNDKVTQITAGAAGETTTGQDITLVEGSSISGKLIYEPDPDSSVALARACVLQPDGSQPTFLGDDPVDCTSTYVIGQDGSYTITGLVPGALYAVKGYASGYLWTSYDGVVVEDWAIPGDPPITPVVAAESGGNVPNIDITLMRPATITGSILPTDVVNDVEAVHVFACPAYTKNGQQYYVTVGSWYSESECYTATVSSPDTSYSIQVGPGRDYVLVAQADGYTDAWYGGYNGESDISNLPTPDREVPATSKVQLVSGTAGQTLTGKDIVFGESQTWTVTFVDGQGTTLVTRTVVDGGSATPPVDPIRTGYVFAGWDVSYSNVTANVTVTAQWTQAPQPVQTVTVTFDAQGGTAVPPVTVAKGESVALPTTSRDEFLFMGWYTQPDGAGTQVSSPMTVAADTVLYASWLEAPAAEVVKEIATVESTGGLARAATGNDPYTLVTTLTDGDGHPMPGLTGYLSAVTPANVTASDFVDISGGKYSVQVSASVPGNYLVRVLLDGVEVPGSPIPVNFIGASIEEPVRMVDDQQEATGLGFLPGEDVVVTVHSDPINIGRRTADAEGRVPVSFDIPKGFDLGHHTVTFAGVTSGTATVSFSVATPIADSSQIQGQTGGTAAAQTNGSLLVLAGVLVVLGLLVQRLRPRTAKRG